MTYRIIAVCLVLLAATLGVAYQLPTSPISALPQSLTTASSPSFAGMTLTGNLLFTDATYDIGALGATRPRNLFASNNIYAANAMISGAGIYPTGSGRTMIYSDADGKLRFFNTNGDDFSMLQFGLTTSAKPALKVVGNSISIRLANDSVGAYASLPACSSAAEGAIAPITDSSTATWGATISGSGSNHVLAYCNGTNWTVAAK